MTLSGKVFGSFQKAIALNPNNPRAHYLLGRMQHGTAQFMGTGNEEACKSLANAQAIYNGSATNENPFAPSWGQEANAASIKEICEGE